MCRQPAWLCEILEYFSNVFHAVAAGASSLTFPVMRELLEELAAPAPTKPNVALAFVAPAGLKEVQAALGSEVRWTHIPWFGSEGHVSLGSLLAVDKLVGGLLGCCVVSLAPGAEHPPSPACHWLWLHLRGCMQAALGSEVRCGAAESDLRILMRVNAVTGVRCEDSLHAVYETVAACCVVSLAPAPHQPNVALVGLKEVQAALGSEVRCGGGAVAVSQLHLLVQVADMSTLFRQDSLHSV
jgi:hypothetical protein